MSDNHIGLREHDGLDQALAAASADAAASGARVFPCTVFRQGRRTMISTSFPYAFLARQVVAESVEKGGDPANTTNRPLMTDHVKNINTYVRDNSDDYSCRRSPSTPESCPPCTFRAATSRTASASW